MRVRLGAVEAETRVHRARILDAVSDIVTISPDDRRIRFASREADRASASLVARIGVTLPELIVANEDGVGCAQSRAVAPNRVLHRSAKTSGLVVSRVLEI